MAEDRRFSALKTDPRYRLSSRKQTRTTVDSRFKRLFTDQDFRKKAKVDRYGRKVPSDTGRNALERLYQLEDEQDSKEIEHATKKNVEAQKKDPARDGGFSDSSSDEESSSDDDVELDSEDKEAATPETTAQVPTGDVTHRIAAVNMDWDNLRATDIMAVATPFLPASGSIVSVAIYPSEFGRGRMEQEDLEGPPREIFARSKRKSSGAREDAESSEESDDEKIKQKLQQDQLNEGEEFDMTTLRQYQLERLRYYYAVITCDSKSTAKAIYDNVDRSEYFSTANYFDLRFIPDETTFEDDTPREECTVLPVGYKPYEFRTDALTHSNVRLTWEGEDTRRKKTLEKAFSRAEMDENDLKAYLAGSDSSDAESVASHRSVGRKTRSKEERRAHTRNTLSDFLSSKPDQKSEVTGGIQVTFTPGLSDKTGEGVFENEPQDEESTRQRYIRKERERKQKRKEKTKADKSGAEPNGQADPMQEIADEQDPGFDDPFFTDPKAYEANVKKDKKKEKQKKVSAQAARDAEAESRRAELELLIADDQADALKHFNMREIEKGEKESRRKNKRSKRGKGAEEKVEDNFEVQTKDPRFTSLYESHEYAIDPSNPRFKDTEAMRALLREGRKRRAVEDGEEEPDRRGRKSVKHRSR